jgi:hypothetical protein
LKWSGTGRFFFGLRPSFTFSTIPLNKKSSSFLTSVLHDVFPAAWLYQSAEPSEDAAWGPDGRRPVSVLEGCHFSINLSAFI